MRRASVALLVLAVLLLAGCGFRAPGQPGPDSRAVRPEQVTSFAALYATNCAGCHGAEGKGGAAQPLNEPLYLAVAGDASIRGVIRRGVAGTSMPAFARAAGGMLTDEQVEAVVAGVRAWARPDAFRGEALPPYAGEAGDAKRGAAVYAASCASCHGAAGQGTDRASSIADGSVLALVSDQSLRTTVITGRPDLGAPDFRGDAAGRPLSPEEISDVVAWLAAQRPEVAGQPYPAASAAVGARP